MVYKEEIEYKGKKVVIELRKITYGEYVEIMKKVLHTDMIGNTSKASLDATELMRLVLKKSIVNKGINVDELDADIGAKLSEVAMRINGLSGDSFFRE